MTVFFQSIIHTQIYTYMHIIILAKYFIQITIRKFHCIYDFQTEDFHLYLLKILYADFKNMACFVSVLKKMSHLPMR